MTRAITALLLPALLILTGCTSPDPFTTPGTWKATGANNANLRAMLVNPADLRSGAAAETARGDAAATPIIKLRAGLRPPLVQATGTPPPAAAGGQDAPR
jgi:type IV pilus biogenesis protein CpaD/CtpE